MSSRHSCISRFRRGVLWTGRISEVAFERGSKHGITRGESVGSVTRLLRCHMRHWACKLERSG